tara:strand:+ start:7797 stop:8105 length:309 start_codon:yes stop_codon:yes gene_type:complete
MGYFAEIDNGKVIQVVVFDGSVSECVEFFGGGTWEVLAHKSEAGIGYDKDEEHDTFVPPKPYPSWQINDTYNGWKPPAGKEKPADGKIYDWVETAQEWVERD